MQTTGNEDDLETGINSHGKADYSDCLETINGDKSTNSKSLILCNPSLEAIEVALKIVNADPKRTIFFDDSVHNIAAGKAAGLLLFWLADMSERKEQILLRKAFTT